MEPTSRKSKKIVFKPAHGCIFMLQGLKVGDSQLLLGSSVDWWLFVYDLTGEAYSDQPVTTFETVNYPVNNANYCSSNNSLVCGTVGGAVYLFRNFSKCYFKDYKVYQSCPEPVYDKFAVCSYWQNDSLWSINFPLNVYKWDPVRHPES
jgi:hypothetical protein